MLSLERSIILQSLQSAARRQRGAAFSINITAQDFGNNTVTNFSDWQRNKGDAHINPGEP